MTRALTNYSKKIRINLILKNYLCEIKRIFTLLKETRRDKAMSKDFFLTKSLLIDRYHT